jgi:hypothetical protein
MLDSRLYNPEDENLIYHYCDAKTFFQICTNHTIRTCDIFSMNDYLEMHWGYSIWEEIATDLIKELGFEFIDEIDKVFHQSSSIHLLLATCFSLNGDSLSQWRSYSEDGKGFAIGFRAKDIIELPIRLLKVLYDKKEQINELKEKIRIIYFSEQLEVDKYSDKFKDKCHRLALGFVSFKNPAFFEEEEIRMVHLVNFERSNNFLKLEDNEGIYFGQKVKEKSIQFMMKDNLPTAFIDYNFTNQDKINPIKEVYLGPKNDSLTTAISVFLETNNLGNVRILKSKASYR